MPLFRKRRTSKSIEREPESPFPPPIPVNSPEKNKKKTAPRPPQWGQREMKTVSQPTAPPPPPPTRTAPLPPSEESSPAASIHGNGHTAGPDGQRIPLLLGRQDPSSRFITPRLFCLHPSLLKHSPVLSKYERHSLTSEDASKIPAIQLPDLDPRAFNMYVKWLNTKRAPHNIVMQKSSPKCDNRKLSWREAWPLVNAHILATTIEDPDFADYAADALVATIEGKWPDKRTIQHVFNTPDMSRRLKQLIIDRAIAAGFGEFKRDEATNWPAEFTAMALEATLRQLGRGTTHWGSCAYHTHSVNEECYRVKWDKSDAAKKWKEESKRKRVTQGSEEAAYISRQNGVKTFDWATGFNGESSRTMDAGPVMNGNGTSSNYTNLSNEGERVVANRQNYVHGPTLNGVNSIEEPTGNRVSSASSGEARRMVNGVSGTSEATAIKMNGTSTGSTGSSESSSSGRVVFGTDIDQGTQNGSNTSTSSVSGVELFQPSPRALQFALNLASGPLDAPITNGIPRKDSSSDVSRSPSERLGYPKGYTQWPGAFPIVDS
ncbi:hypothetical protein P154DRAFT_570315 [Amniculicola lignicola CBS 123094]|uniref:BTB domain-containing protein n=1 Tax=Amniculicola lignicola CBS 123094 TaxID=1392246 RepID=A0A6A5WWY1_9PLEO|nr:hypothetical protein P154DRAFT_570315 [Amniculicola lignicola CBS 123094]